MTMFEHTLGAILANPEIHPKDAFSGLAKAMIYDSGETSNRASCEFGKAGKANPYNFAQYLVTNHRGIVIAIPQNFDIIYTVVIKILDKPVVVQLSKKATSLSSDDLVGTALIAAPAISMVSVQFAAIVNKWKAF